MFFFDRCLLWVQTGSMQPTIPEKSYILAEKAQGTQVQVGDVIVFLCRDTTSPVYGNYVAHRVVQRDGDGYKTKGDSPLAQVDPWTVERADILAVYQKNLPAMTALGRLFATPMGMVAVLALFCGVWICLHPDNGENAENGTGGAAHRRRIRRAGAKGAAATGRRGTGSPG